MPRRKRERERGAMMARRAKDAQRRAMAAQKKERAGSKIAPMPRAPKSAADDARHDVCCRAIRLRWLIRSRC